MGKKAWTKLLKVVLIMLKKSRASKNEHFCDMMSWFLCPFMSLDKANKMVFCLVTPVDSSNLMEWKFSLRYQ